MVRAIVFSAATILTLLEAPEYLGRNSQSMPVLSTHHIANVSLEVGDKPSRLFSVLPDTYSQSVYGNPLRDYAPFSCLELQIIDETELISDAVDCD